MLSPPAAGGDVELGGAAPERAPGGVRGAGRAGDGAAAARAARVARQPSTLPRLPLADRRARRRQGSLRVRIVPRISL